MQVGAIQLTVLLFVFRERPCQVRKGTHAPELISRPVNTSVNYASGEHTQLCNLRYVHVLICLLTVVNVGGAPPVKRA